MPSGSRDLHLLAMATGALLSLLTAKPELVVRGVYGAGETECIAFVAAYFALRAHRPLCGPGEHHHHSNGCFCAPVRLKASSKRVWQNCPVQIECDVTGVERYQFLAKSSQRCVVCRQDLI